MIRVGHGFLLSLSVASAQILPAPFALAPALAQDSKDCTPVPDVQAMPAMQPLKDDVTVGLQIVVGRDGSVTDAHVMDSGGSGDAARDAAMLAHVKQSWRYRPRAEGCRNAELRVTVHFPHITCAPAPLKETWTEPDVALQDRPRAVELQVGVSPDGAVQTASVLSSSGVAALDAAAVAHVKAAWRWQPFACAASPLMTGTVRVEFSWAPP
jgi:TonB family protein